MRFIGFFLILIGSVSYGQSAKATETKPLPIFVFGSTTINTDEFLYLYRKNHQKKEDFTDVKIQEYLDLFINFKLKVAEAYQRGFDTTAAFKKEFGSYKEELKKPYQAGKDDLDKLTHEAYERLGEEVKASHILISIKQDPSPADTLEAYQKISEIRNKLIAGSDFQALAREFSQDPSAKANGGDLGYFTAMQMVYPFEQAAYTTTVGEISPLVRTRFGYHILKIQDRRKSKGEIEVSHILLRTGTSNDGKVKNSIFEIYDQLKGGRNWDELCKEFSEDTNTKNSGGRLRPFGVGALASVPEFEAVSFSLQQPGEISDPFQSGVGWHIIRLEKKIPLPPFKEMEASLKRRVSRDERLQISQTALITKRKKEFEFIEMLPTKQYIFSQADSSLIKGNWNYTGIEEEKAKPLFSLQSKNIFLNEFIAYIIANQTKNALSPSAYMTLLYDKFINESMNIIEEQKLIAENVDYRLLLNEYKEGILLFEIMEREVWNKASEDSLGQHIYYNEHQDKYKAGDRIEARIFSTSDKAFLDEIGMKIEKGDTLRKEDLKKFKSIQNNRAYEKGDNKVIDRINWVIGVQKTEADGMHYLVEVNRLRPPGGKSFEEARASIISDYQDALEKAWVAQLRQKYPVKINKKGKKLVIAELQK